MTTTSTKTAKKTPIIKSMTASQRAEAVALWRAGSVTLEDLATRFKRRPETLSRLFKRMGVEKGSAVEEQAKKLAAAAETAALNDVEVTLSRIASVRNEHFQMSSSLARIAWSEIVRAKKASLPLHTLKDTMATLKMAGEVIGNSRKELFEVLNVVKHEKEGSMDDLPELTVRELTTDDIESLRGHVEMDDQNIVSADMLDLDDDGEPV